MRPAISARIEGLLDTGTTNVVNRVARLDGTPRSARATTEASAASGGGKTGPTSRLQGLLPRGQKTPPNRPPPATRPYRTTSSSRGERLANLSALTGEGAQVQGVIGASAKGDFVYFAAKGVLAPGASAGKNNLYVWHEGEGVRFLASLGAEDGAAWNEFFDGQRARVSPDGGQLAFLSKERLTGFDNAVAAGQCVVGKATPNCAEVFLYDYDADALDCASCNAASAKPLGPASLPVCSTPYEQPRYLSDSGRLFFATYDALSPHAQRPLTSMSRAPGTGSCDGADPP